MAHQSRSSRHVNECHHGKTLLDGCIRYRDRQACQCIFRQIFKFRCFYRIRVWSKFEPILYKIIRNFSIKSTKQGRNYHRCSRCTASGPQNERPRRITVFYCKIFTLKTKVNFLLFRLESTHVSFLFIT